MESLWPEDYPATPPGELRPPRSLRRPTACRSTAAYTKVLLLRDQSPEPPEHNVSAGQPKPVRREQPRPPTSGRLAVIGRLGGLAKSARYDSREATAPARAGLWAKFLAEADPAGTLTLAERQRRATALMRLHMSRLALRSAQARSRRSGGLA